jgi:PRC-barrel domain
MGCFPHIIRRPPLSAAATAIFGLVTVAFPALPQNLTNQAPSARAIAQAPPEATPPAKPQSRLTPKGTAGGILGKPIFDVDGANMGLVTDVLVDRSGKPLAAVVDFGGFLGVGTRKIAIAWDLLQFHPGDPKKPVTLSMTKAQLRAAPAYTPGKAAKILTAPPAAAPAPKPPSSDQTGPK